MPARAHLGLALLAALLLLPAALAACGGGSGSSSSSTSTSTSAVTTVPGDANASDVAVIEQWAQALKRGDVKAAAGYFAIPSVAENGPLLLKIHNAGQAQAFNESLPCGAYVIRAESVGHFTTATFRLTERPGPGSCGPGTGSMAQTSFVIRDGKIVEWRRVGTGGPSEAPPSQTS